jgi:pheromone shutdown protein TraB
MVDAFKPIEMVGDVVVVGEIHRSNGSRNLVQEVISEHNFSAVCVEESYDCNNWYRPDFGGAIGYTLNYAENEDIPRYYVDMQKDHILDVFDSTYEADKYFNSIDEKCKKELKDIESSQDGLIKQSLISSTRDKIFRDFGNKGRRKLLKDREIYMSGRTEWVSQEYDGKILLVIGAGHFNSVIEYLRQNIEPKPMDDEYLREGKRITDPYKAVVYMFVTQIKLLIKKIKTENYQSN